MTEPAALPLPALPSTQLPLRPPARGLAPPEKATVPHPAERRRGRDLISQIKDLSFEDLPPLTDQEQADRDAAEVEMWHWYKDWAQLARTVITKKRVRVAMGISQLTSGGTIEDTSEDDPDVNDDGNETDDDRGELGATSPTMTPAPPRAPAAQPNSPSTGI